MKHVGIKHFYSKENGFLMFSFDSELADTSTVSVVFICQVIRNALNVMY